MPKRAWAWSVEVRSAARWKPRLELATGSLGKGTASAVPLVAHKDWALAPEGGRSEFWARGHGRRKPKLWKSCGHNGLTGSAGTGTLNGFEDRQGCGCGRLARVPHSLLWTEKRAAQAVRDSVFDN